MQTLKFTIPIIPRSQQRAKIRIVKTKNGKPFPVAYKDKQQRNREESLKTLLYRYEPSKIFNGSLYLIYTAFLPIAKSDSKKLKASKVDNITKHIKKPDLDNLTKHLKDCMQDIFYQNDSQICQLSCKKQYSDNPRWEITLIALEE